MNGSHSALEHQTCEGSLFFCGNGGCGKKKHKQNNDTDNIV